MAITDLTGTTWVFNDTPTTAYNKLYNINFTSNNEKKSLLFVSGIIGYGSSTDNYGKYRIVYMPNSSVSVPFFANVNNFLLYYTETDNINWNSIQLTYSADKKANILSNYQYISLKPDTRYVLCPYRSDAEWLAGPTTGSHANGSDSNFLRISKFSTSTFSMSNFLSSIKYPNYTSNLTPVASAYPVVSDNTYSYVTAYTTPSAGFTVAAFNTITITGGTDATNSELISWLQANATLQLPVSFKRYYKYPVLLGSGTYKFQPYTVAQPKLATVSGVSVAEKSLSFEGVKNAAEYGVLLDGANVGTVKQFPIKGNLIIIENKQYRVLKIDGSIAEILAMYSAPTNQKFDANSSYNNFYAGKTLDTYLSGTFYDSLSTNIKNAITPKTFTQDSWHFNAGTSGGKGNPIYQGIYSSSSSGYYRLGLGSLTYGSSITRNCYVLSIQDIIDYLDVTNVMTTSNTTLTDTNIWKMFWNQTTSPELSVTPWLRSANSGYSDLVFVINSYFGYPINTDASITRDVRPAFQIDLSKIAFTIVEE